MACTLDLKLVLKHLANGTICENLCRVCLKPLNDDCENIFTKICKEDKEYCIADVLNDLCQIKISDADHYSVCSECFIAASNAYKFYLNTKCNDRLLHFYLDELETYLNTINMTDDISGESICISLPLVLTEMAGFDYKIKTLKDTNCNKGNNDNQICIKQNIIKQNIPVKHHKPVKNVQIENEDDEIVIFKDENGHSTFYKIQSNGLLQEIEYKAPKPAPPAALRYVGNKKRKKREPMTVKQCTRCPIEYRFISKLQEHMKTEHGVILYACKLCQALTEDEELHKFHLKTHTFVYKCDICSVPFRKREAVINHMRAHEKFKHRSTPVTDLVCVQCGLIFNDKETIINHVNTDHYQKFTCYYCGRIYKVKESFDKHIQKHEIYTKAYKERVEQQEKRSFTTAEAKKLIARSEEASSAPSKDYTCELCGRGFRGARALLWHGRLHTNERPFKCDTCGRAFVSLNRRNQHALCAHSAPARRCPLCPARFHLRSMVNTHVKKVHLKAHKRRARGARVARADDAGARPVPVQELSVALQQDVLDMQARAVIGDLSPVNSPWNAAIQVEK
ncbi:hypothetical protein ABMA28_010627 [Loxostege sticticalis]